MRNKGTVVFHCAILTLLQCFKLPAYRNMLCAINPFYDFLFIFDVCQCYGRYYFEKCACRLEYYFICD